MEPIVEEDSRHQEIPGPTDGILAVPGGELINGGTAQSEVGRIEPATTRVVTDKITLMVFLITMALWMVSVGYGYSMLYGFDETELESASQCIDQNASRITLIEVHVRNSADNANCSVNAVRRPFLLNRSYDEVLHKYQLNMPSISSSPAPESGTRRKAVHGAPRDYSPRTLLHISPVSVITGNNDSGGYMVVFQMVQYVVHDVREAKHFVMGSVAVTFAVTAAFMVSLRWTAEVTVWMVLAVIGLMLLTGLVSSFSRVFRGDVSSVSPALTWIGPRGQWCILTAIVAGIFIAYILIVYMKVSSIKKGIALIKESSRLIRCNLSPMLIAAVPTIFHCFSFFLMASGVCFLSISSIEEWEEQAFNRSEDGCRCIYCFKNISEGGSTDPSLVRQLCESCSQACIPVPREWHFPEILWYLNFFAYVWSTAFFLHLSYTILGGSFVFTYRKSNLNTSMHTTLFVTLNILKYHIGTIATGTFVSLVSGTYKLFKLLFFHGVIETQMICCHSYIICAIHGTPFKESARRVMGASNTNLLRASNVVNIIFFLVQLGIACAVTGTNHLILEMSGVEQLYGGFATSLLVLLLTWTTSTALCSAGSVAAESLVIVFMEDQISNGDPTQASYHIPLKLVKSLSKKGKNHNETANIER